LFTIVAPIPRARHEMHRAEVKLQGFSGFPESQKKKAAIRLALMAAIKEHEENLTCENVNNQI
jgi:hypothetical protein